MIQLHDVNDLLDYCADTGFFVWRNSRGRVKAGDIAGHVRYDGYISLRIKGEPILAHRLAWLIATGAFPCNEIDHINCVRHDNRIINLRESNHSQNNDNVSLQVNNTSGYKGLSWHKQKECWRATITINGKQKHLGLFTDKLAAHAAYCEAAENHFGEFARYN
jgi:hypothetical protein